MDILVKQKLAESVEILLKQQRVESIRVMDILEISGISKSTFYRHFDDKYALINWVYAQYVDEICRVYSHIACCRYMMYAVTEFLAEKKAFFTKVLEYGGQNSLKSLILDTTESVSRSRMLRILKTDQLSVQDEYMIHFHAVGTVETLSEWIHNGCPQSPEEISELILEFMPKRLYRYLVEIPHDRWFEQTGYAQTGSYWENYMLSKSSGMV